jgi:large subunit ribosomal protein L6
MSRIGKIPVSVPKEVKVVVTAANINFEGPKGKNTLPLPGGITVESKDGTLLVKRSGETKQDRSNHGTTQALIRGMIQGVLKGHVRELEIQGVGFRAQTQGNKLTLNLGFSHPVEYDVPAGVKVTTPKPTIIVLESPDKSLVGLAAAKIRGFKPPEPYKGKGIRYSGELVKRKQGKAVTK